MVKRTKTFLKNLERSENNIFIIFRFRSLNSAKKCWILNPVSFFFLSSRKTAFNFFWSHLSFFSFLSFLKMLKQFSRLLSPSLPKLTFSLLCSCYSKSCSVRSIWAQQSWLQETNNNTIRHFLGIVWVLRSLIILAIR